MFDIVKDSVWIKAADLIKEKYGKSLSYRSIKLIATEATSAQKELFYSNGDDLIIPLKAKNVNLGDVIVDRGSLLDTQQKSEVADLVKFLVEPKLYNIQLKKSEARLNGTTRPSLTLVASENASLVELFNEEVPRRKTLSQIILLKSHTELTRNRVALKMHEMTERNLFVHLDDIISSLSSKDDLSTLSDITIYIADIQALSASTLRLLKEYLEGSSEDGPLFLVGSSLTMEAIETQDWPESLKRDLIGFYFDIDRVPLAQQTSEDILELLFFQFDSK
ncbi:MAG: hypothetical protein ACXWQQ_14080, partial [Pseudobdellovibrio sp.]